MQTARLHNQLHKPDYTAHEETNYIKVQHIQFSLCLADYYENAHDCKADYSESSHDCAD